MATLEIKGLSFAYNGSGEDTLRNININISTNEFTLICGATGSGKTTLVRLLKPELMPVGELKGAVTLDGEDIASLEGRQSVERIGYVGQDCQPVCDRVWHELAFTPEGLGAEPKLIRRRCGEVSGFFAIEELFERTVDSLSGGERQSVALAAALTSAPEVLVLDEPVSRLDPVCAAELVGRLRRINSELGIGIVLCEHRLEGLMDMCDRIIVLHKGEVFWQGSPDELDTLPYPSPVEENLPAEIRLHRRLGLKGVPPLSIAGGKRAFSHLKGEYMPENVPKPSGEVAVEVKGLHFGYQRGSSVLKDLSLKVYKGEHFALMGGNGSGKSTLLYLIAGAYKPVMGRIKRDGSLTLLPQSPAGLFTCDKVAEEVADRELCRLFDLEADKNPLDLSGGQQQLLGLVKAVERNSDILLLDEPTKALDGAVRGKVAELIMGLNKRGVTVITVSHDMEFCAACAHRCGLLFNGEIVAVDDTRSFFVDNMAYTTPVNKLIRGNVLTVEEAVECIREE